MCPRRSCFTVKLMFEYQLLRPRGSTEDASNMVYHVPFDMLKIRQELPSTRS